MKSLHLCLTYPKSTHFVLTLSLLLFASCVRQPVVEQTPPSGPPVLTFAVMGDVPYGLTPEEVESEKIILLEQISHLNENSAIEFVAHVGDIKKVLPPCEPDVYESVAEILKASNHPLFIIPGDNEWNDCTNPTEAWQFWESNFMRFEENWTHDLDVAHQPERDENFAFIRNGVLFLGINLVGGKVHDWEEWQTRIEDDRRWLEVQFKKHSEEAFAAVIFAHANPGSILNKEFVYKKQALRPLIEYLDQTTSIDFPKPILFIHGDGHKWIADLPFPNAGNRIARIQVTQGGLEAPLLVELRNDPTNPFYWIRNQ